MNSSARFLLNFLAGVHDVFERARATVRLRLIGKGFTFGADFRFACLKEATLVVLLKYLSSIVRLTLDGVSNVDRGRIDFEASQLIF